MSEHVAEILIVGAGPVGLVLAMDLASRGVASVIIEERSVVVPADPKCNTTSARSMEQLRRLGCHEEYRKCGLPDDFANDVAWSTSVTGHELGRLNLPSSGKRWLDDNSAFDGGWPSVERPHRASQMYLERVLREHVKTYGPLIDLRFSTKLVDVKQDDNGQNIAEIENFETSEKYTIKARFVVGCDGGRSQVRRSLDIEMVGGFTGLHKMWSVLVKSPDMYEKTKSVDGRKIWMNWIFNKDSFGSIVAINGTDNWLFHSKVPEGLDHDEYDYNVALKNMVGEDFEYEVLQAAKWQLNRVVADTYKKGSAFLAGDACHAWPPWAGFGMNSGIEDAIGLGWQLAAVIKGWASEDILVAYDVERRSIGEQISQAAEGMARSQKDIGLAPEVIEKISEDNEEGALTRKKVGDALVRVDSQQFNPIGLNFGLYYTESPIICFDGGEPPEFKINRYVPSTVPSCRAPHFFLNDGMSLFDKFGEGYTLVSRDQDIDLSSFEQSASACGMPLEIVDISTQPKAYELYDHKLVLIRPDYRIAWRGNTVPNDVGKIIDKVRGVK